MARDHSLPVSRCMRGVRGLITGISSVVGWARPGSSGTERSWAPLNTAPLAGACSRQQLLRPGHTRIAQKAADKPVVHDGVDTRDQAHPHVVCHVAAHHGIATPGGAAGVKSAAS